MDIVDRLRDKSHSFTGTYRDEAADEIERLRADLWRMTQERDDLGRRAFERSDLGDPTRVLKLP